MPFASQSPITNIVSSIASTVVGEIRNVADAAMSLGELSGSPFVMPPNIMEVCSPVVGFPLQFQSAREYISPRVALLGDSAHSIHPMAGQGLNLGVADASVLADVLTDTLNSGGDIGSLVALQKYETSRFRNNIAMMSVVDSLQKVFASDLRVIQRLRAIGMQGINSSSLIKGEMAKFAMGIRF